MEGLHLKNMPFFCGKCDISGRYLHNKDTTFYLSLRSKENKEKEKKSMLIFTLVFRGKKIL